MKPANDSPVLDTEALAERLTFAYNQRVSELLTIEEMVTYKALHACAVAWTTEQLAVVAKIERDEFAAWLIAMLSALEGRAPEYFTRRTQET